MDDLGKSIPAAEGMIDAEQSGGSKRHNEFCLNCGVKLIDVFCHHCGQKDIARRQTLGELFSNFISSFWSYEGKFFLTTKYLIMKPGFLAVEYNAGRRESYYHPARMYVFISFVFFLLFFSLPDGDGETKKIVADKNDLNGEDLKDAREGLKKGNIDSLMTVLGQDTTLRRVVPGLMDSIKAKKKKKKYGNWNVGLQKAEYSSVQTYDSTQATKAENDRDGWFKRKLTVRAIELSLKYKDEPGKFGKDFLAGLKDNFSKILFYLLPVFALLLKLLYVRRDYYYSEHLVFSIYYYNFFYLAGSIQMLVGLVPGLGWLNSIIGFWIFFYLLFAMKRLYVQSWRKTIFKFVLFSFAFFFCAMIGLSVTALAILMII